MATRKQFLENLHLLSALPKGAETDCTICAGELVNPVELCPKHIFCRECAVQWLTTRRINTCPACRRELFVLPEEERAAVGMTRMQIVAQALRRSGLLTYQFDQYGHPEYFTMSEIQRAAAAANLYLAEERRVPITGGAALVDMRLLAPHVVAMANLLREYAGAANRAYSEDQRRDWRILVDHVREQLVELNGRAMDGDMVVHIANSLRMDGYSHLTEMGLDVNATGFFFRNGAMESPAGDLDLLVEYIVYQCKQIHERRELERVARRARVEASERGASRSRQAMGSGGHRTFGGS